IVMVERTALDGDGRVVVEVPAAVGDHVRPAGEDLAPGQVVFEAGTVRGPGHRGVLPRAGCRNVPVSPRPPVAVLAPGGELVGGPAVRKGAGCTELHRPRGRAVADEALRRGRDGKLHLVRVFSAFGGDGRLHVRSSGGQASSLLRSMALANALALVPDGDGVD